VKNLEQAHAKGTEFLSSLARVHKIDCDITIVTNGGYPLDQIIYQAVKGMTSAEATNKKGGVTAGTLSRHSAGRSKRMAVPFQPQGCPHPARQFPQSGAEAGGGARRSGSPQHRKGRAYVSGELPVIAADFLNPVRRACERPEVHPGSHAPRGRNTACFNIQQKFTFPASELYVNPGKMLADFREAG